MEIAKAVEAAFDAAFPGDVKSNSTNATLDIAVGQDVGSATQFLAFTLLFGDLVSARPRSVSKSTVFATRSFALVSVSAVPLRAGTLLLIPAQGVLGLVARRRVARATRLTRRAKLVRVCRRVGGSIRASHA